MSEQTQEQAVASEREAFEAIYPCPIEEPGPAYAQWLARFDGWLARANINPRPGPQAFDPVEALAEIHRMLKPGRPLHTPEMNYHCIVDHLSAEIDLPFDVATSPPVTDIAQMRQRFEALDDDVWSDANVAFAHAATGSGLDEWRCRFLAAYGALRAAFGVNP